MTLRQREIRHSGKGPNPLTMVRIWQSMRCLRNFTLQDIMATSESARSYTANILMMLKRAGYLRKVEKVYSLIIDSGPRPPKIGPANAYVYDRNEGKIYWKRE